MSKLRLIPYAVLTAGGMLAASGAANAQSMYEINQRQDYQQNRIEQGILQQDVLDRVPRQRQLREHRERDVVVMALPGRLPHRLRVGGRVRDRGVDRAGGHTDEPMPVGGVEIHGVSHNDILALIALG